MKVPEPRKLPSGNYTVQIRLNGVSVSVTRKTAKECRDAATLIKAEHKANKREIGRVSTLSNAIERYIDKRSSVLSPATIRGYRVAQRNYFRSAMNVPIDKVDWQKEVNSMAREYAPKTVKNAWRFVSSVLKENNISVKNVTLPKQEAKERDFLSPEQIKLFVRLLDGKDVQIPALLALHSLRRSEIAGLDWKNIDLKKRTITIASALVPDEDGNMVLRKTTKTDTSHRTIPIMIPELYDALLKIEDKKGAVCKMHPNSIYKAVNTICENNDLPLVGVHGLRHSFASLAYNIGLSEKQTMELGGWSDFGTMRRIYTHLDDKSKQDARLKMQSFFEAENKNANENANEF